MAESLSKAAGQVLSLLPSDGKPVGNLHLKRELRMGESEFLQARTELLDQGLACSGKGRGGSLRRNHSGAGGKVNLPIESLAEPQSTRGKAEHKTRQLEEADPDREFENRAWSLVYKLGPVLITTGRDPLFSIEDERFQPDVIAVFGDFLLVTDCKNTTHGTYVSSWLARVEHFRERILRLAKNAGLNQVVYLCFVKQTDSLDKDVHSLANRLKVRLIDSSAVSYFRDLEVEAGIGVRHLFWARYAPRVVHLEEECLPALSVKLGKRKEAFVFSINAHKLLPRVVVSHRELHGRDGVKGYQRMLKRTRLRAIAKHIEKFKTFPTPIVVALDRNSRFDLGKGEDEKSVSRLGRLRLPGNPGRTQIIDGQHRLFGYSLLPFDERHVVHVVGYKTDENLDPATMFVDINAKQKPVPSSLLWELYPDIYSEESADFYRSMISEAVENAIEAIKGKVTHITSGTKGPITFQSLCSEVAKCGLLTRKRGLVRLEAHSSSAQTKKLQQWLTVFFDVIGELETTYPKAVQSLLLRNVGMIPALRFFVRILNYERIFGNPTILSNVSDLKACLRDYLTEVCSHYEEKELLELEQLRSVSSSQGGFKKLFTEFCAIVDKRFRPGFAPRNHGNLSILTEEIVSAMAEINRKGVSLGTTTSAVFKELDSTALKRIAKKKEFDIDSFEKFIGKLHQEIVESSGENKPDNRLSKLLGVTELFSVPILRKLTNLRVFFSHKTALIDPSKRKAALEVVRDLLGSTQLKEPEELAQEELNLLACNILSELQQSVFVPATNKIKGV